MSEWFSTEDISSRYVSTYFKRITETPPVQTFTEVAIFLQIGRRWEVVNKTQLIRRSFSKTFLYKLIKLDYLFVIYQKRNI